MNPSYNIHQILRENWGYSEFRPGQEPIINDILAGKDTIALLPTGGGKSLCFQVPALAMNGVCLVISPLIALMKDQVAQLKRRHIPAEALTSGMSLADLDRILDNAVYGNVKFLYLSPERLKSDLVRERIKRMEISLVAIDEAHCISQWGYDFRPPYLEIAEIRAFLPGVVFAAFTASATKKVITDIGERLEMAQPVIHENSFYRPNLIFSVQFTDGQEQAILDTLSANPGSSIIYIRSRKQTVTIATRLTAMGISATAYHAGLEREERASRQAMWTAGDIRVMVATNAFGMGIDKPDVRNVIHLELAESPEAYYQEAGRAGRDGQPAEAKMILHRGAIDSFVKRTKELWPDIDMAKRVYTALANHLQIPIGSGEQTFSGLDLPEFCTKYDFEMRQAYTALGVLERYGLIRLAEGYKPTSFVHIHLAPRDLYEFEVEQPRFAPLVKQLLRWYGGITSGPTAIDERALAAAIQLPGQSLSKQLKALDGMNVLEYKPAYGGSSVEWVLPRMESNYLPISRKDIHQLIEQSKVRMNAMIEYATHPTECRFQSLLHYFGQDSTPCGKCDTCRSRKAVAPSIPTTEKRILDLLKDQALTYLELETSLADVPPAMLKVLLGQLLDEELVNRSEDGRYSASRP